MRTVSVDQVKMAYDRLFPQRIVNGQLVNYGPTIRRRIDTAMKTYKENVQKRQAEAAAAASEKKVEKKEI
jgi:predicted membrane chloride channel (bestrophin family)